MGHQEILLEAIEQLVALVSTEKSGLVGELPS